MEVIKNQKEFFQQFETDLLENNIKIWYKNKGVLYISSTASQEVREELIKHWKDFQSKAFKFFDVKSIKKININEEKVKFLELVLKKLDSEKITINVSV